MSRLSRMLKLQEELENAIPSNNQVVNNDNSSEYLANPVVVVNIKMPFWSMVTFLIKLAIASVPAAIVIFLIFIGLTTAFGGVFGSFLGRGY